MSPEIDNNKSAETEVRQGGFAGRHVVAFESRFATEIGKLITNHHGLPILAPAMAEVPLAQNVSAFEFADKLFQGQLPVVLFLTGVGTRALLEVLESRYLREEIVTALNRITVVARGPKPVAALRTFGVSVSLAVPEPNTWRELLDILDTSERVPSLDGIEVAVQEYGVPNLELLEGLKKRGAKPLAVPIYRWTLPADTGPLRDAIHAIVNGDCRVALFTNAMQVSHLFQVAGQIGFSEQLREALDKLAVCSIGPVCSEALFQHRVQVDMEPRHPKMGQLVAEASVQVDAILEKKRTRSSVRVDIISVPLNPASSQEKAWNKLENSVFMRACRRLPTDYTPVWLMRQAGRYMPEYREIRAKNSFLELCKNSDLAAEVTVTAAHRLNVDAAIIFADILLIVEPMGLGLRFDKGEGPSIDGMIRGHEDIERLQEVEPEDSLHFVFDAIRKARAGLHPGLPLIGFAGSPFTLASYIVEGGASKSYRYTKTLMYQEPKAWHDMMASISRSLVKYLNGQIRAGVQAVQLFDSWVGCLSPGDYQEFVLPHTRSVIRQIQPGIPVINFSTGTSSYLKIIRQAGGDVIGIDWRIDLAEAWLQIGFDVGIQGNLDPLVLFSNRDYIAAKARGLLSKADNRPGYIFNLGHGILPDTPVDNVLTLVDAVHEHGR